MKRIFILLSELFLFVMLTASIQAEQPVGYIEQMGGPGSAFELYRGEEKKNVAIMTTLYAGDQLKIRTEQCKKDEGDTCTITLKLGEQRTVQVDSSMCPYTIEPAGKPPNLPVKLMKKLTSWFKRSHKEHRIILAMKNTGSDVDLRAPLFTKYKACLTAGKRTFYLSWYGGEAPYRVRLYRDGVEKPLLEQHAVQDIRLQQDNLTLTEGIYRVEVIDVENQKVEGHFQAVSQEILPVLPTEFSELLQQSILEDRVKNTLFAVWLINEHEGWEFEAYQLVAPIADEYYPALLVREQLELE